VNPSQTSQEERYRFHRMLLGIVTQRGYSPGWADHKFKEKHGEWPPRHWSSAEPETPDDATRAWVRSRTIAWAKRSRAV
jgi:DNA repair protein RadD